MFRAKVFVTLKRSVLDPQGQAVAGSLRRLGFGGVREARVGKYIELDIEGTDRERVEAEVRQMCERLLANTVIEEYRVELEAGAGR